MEKEEDRLIVQMYIKKNKTNKQLLFFYGG